MNSHEIRNMTEMAEQLESSVNRRGDATQS